MNVVNEKLLEDMRNIISQPPNYQGTTMSNTPTTDDAVNNSPALGALVSQADANPVVADDLAAAFGKMSHASGVQIISFFIVWVGAQKGLSVDPATAATYAAFIAGATGYAYSYFRRRIAKAKVV